MRKIEEAPNPDSRYEALLAAHRGLSDAQSAALNARLILVLSNEVDHVTFLKSLHTAQDREVRE